MVVCGRKASLRNYSRSVHAQQIILHWGVGEESEGGGEGLLIMCKVYGQNYVDLEGYID